MDNVKRSNPVYDTVGAGLVGQPKTPCISRTYDASQVTAVTLEKGRLHRFWASTDCYIVFGTGTPTADETGIPLTGKTAEYFTPLVDDLKVAVVKIDVAGVLKINPMYREGEAIPA